MRKSLTCSLDNTPYVVEGYGFTFYFSSESKANNFKRNMDVMVAHVNNQLAKLYYLKSDCPFIALNKLYVSLETRGYRIEYNGTLIPRDVSITCSISGLTNV